MKCQTEKDKYVLTYMWNLKKPKFIETEQTGGCHRPGLAIRKMGKGGQEVQTPSYYRRNKL